MPESVRVVHGMGVEDEVVVVEMSDGRSFPRGYLSFLHLCLSGISRTSNHDTIMLDGDEEVDRLVLQCQ